MRKIIGLGETVLDIIFKNHQVQKAVPGGSTFNALISLGRSRANCMMVTEVGDDKVGELIVNFLKDNGVNADFVYRHKGTQSHISLAFLNDRNDAEYSFYKMHGDLNLPMNFPEMNKGDIILFGSFFAINPKLRKYVTTFLNKAKTAGAIIYYDINFRAAHVKDLPIVKHYIEDNIKMATIVRGSAEDFDIMIGAKTAEEAYSYVKTICNRLIYTDAENPIKVFIGNRKLSYPVNPIKTVSTIGAGDNFNAGFCYGLYTEIVDSEDSLNKLTEKQIKRLISYGQEFSSEVCQSLDNYIKGQ